MNNKEPQNCWEYWNCPKETREKCAAYKYNSGKECWMIASAAEPHCPRVGRDFKYCSECPWYKKLNSSHDK